MARWQHVYGDAPVEVEGGKPVRLTDLLRRVSPSFQMGADAEADDGDTHLVLQGGDGGVIEMVPVVVRDEQIVDMGHVLYRVDGRSLECVIDEGNRRRGRAEHG